MEPTRYFQKVPENFQEKFGIISPKFTCLEAVLEFFNIFRNFRQY